MLSRLIYGLALLGLAASPAAASHARPPGVPRSVHAVAAKTTARVGWAAAAANGSPILHYQVAWRRDDSGGGSKTALTAGTARALSIHGLVGGATYEISVRAMNHVGWGPRSRPVRVVIAASDDLRKQLEGWTAGHPAVGNPSLVLQPPGTSNATLRLEPHLYPGAVVEGKPDNIVNGILTPVPLTPGGGTLTLTGIQLKKGGTVTAHVTRADEPHVTQAIQNLRAQDQFQSNGLDTAHLQFQQVNSAEQAARDVNASYSYAGVGSASGDFHEADDESENHLLFEMQQTYYSVAYQPDAVAGHDDLEAFFAPGTTAADANQCGCMNSSAPPMFVSNVVYGTRFVFLASSKADSEEMKLAIKASLSVGGSTSVSLTSDEKSVFDEMTLSVVAVGGDVQTLGTAEAGALGTNGKNVTNWLGSFVTHSLEDGLQYSVPLEYTLDYLDYDSVGEYLPPLTAGHQIAAGDTVDSLTLTTIMGTDDRSCQDPVTVSLTDNAGEQLIPNSSFNGTIAGRGGTWDPCKTRSPYCVGVNSSGDYWNNSGAGQGPITCTLPLPHPIPAWAIAGSTLNIVGPGDSWHAGFTIGFQLPALGTTPAGTYLAYTTTPNMFFDVDAFHGNPCDDKSRNIGYSLTLAEPKDPQAQSQACPAAIPG